MGFSGLPPDTRYGLYNVKSADIGALLVMVPLITIGALINYLAAVLLYVLLTVGYWQLLIVALPAGVPRVVPHVLWAAILPPLLVALLAASSLDPTDRGLYGGTTGSFRCTFCQASVGSRTKHCRICNRCTEGFDHHCVWLNTCIGKRNYRPFLALLVATTLLLLHYTWLAIYELRHWGSHFAALTVRLGEVWGPKLAGPPLWFTLVAVMLLVQLLALYLVLELLAFHLVLSVKSVSTYDYILA